MVDASPETEPGQRGNPGKKKAKEEDDATQGVKKPGSKAQGRKRTKTGCLTCRRRRIKCGEERPTCSNCTKSKRQCEGYNQRVVFKDPLNAYRGPPVSSHVQFSEPTPAVRHGDPFPQPSSAGGPLPIAPKPPGSFGSSFISTEIADPLPASTTPGAERRVYGFNTDFKHQSMTSMNQQHGQNQTFDITVDTVDHSRLPEPRKGKSPQDQATHYDFDALEPIKQETRYLPSTTPASTSPLEWSAGPSTSATFYRTYPNPADWQAIPTTSQPAAPPLIINTSSTSSLRSPLDSEASKSSSATQYDEKHPQTQQLQQQVPGLGNHYTWEPSRPIPNQEDYFVEDDDDPFDVSDNDDQMEDFDDSEEGPSDNQDQLHLRNNDLGVVVALQARQDTQRLAVRSITSYIDRPDMLATYVPSPQASPLQDPMAARIFCHFINVTGPTMSMFERHPANPSLIFQGRPVPISQQHIWTYTFPTLALHDQGLLHAMLAIASLHIAKLQNGPITASLKHYAYSLRKIGRSISNPNRKGQPATLAAAMLLAFYECWCADHQKWSNHILGAKMLVKEIDFAGMTRYIKSLKLRQRMEERAKHYGAQQQLVQGMEDERVQHHWTSEDIDENIVSMLMGKKLRYDQYGRIMEDKISDDGTSKTYTEGDLEIYETQRDLFWWYCKQDTYQSMLGGGRLFLEYDRWSHCPPRAPLGRLNATYGTFDHLILLMGRLADFASKDVHRKRLAMKANGGYRPPGMPPQMPGQPGQQGQGASQPQPQMPSFTGMVPGVGEAKLPMGFEQTQTQSPQSSQSTQSEDVDPEILRVEAEEEWQEIRNAFSVLEDHFGNDFQALGPEFSTPIQTPFGPALQYRTYGIAGIWLNYYMALITCHRVHPSMPPAAMMAAGIAARNTDTFANEIGRIAAGIAPECGMTSGVSPGVAAALIESGTALFIAGVQYQNAAQRHWTVNRLRDMARLTGWQTANAVCTGLETSWVKVAELGKGPPYVRTSDDRIVPDVRRIGEFHMGLILEWILSVPEIDS